MPRTVLWPGRDIAWKDFFSRVVGDFRRDAMDDVAAALTFYAVLSIFPFLMFVIAVASHGVSWTTIESLVSQADRMAPPDVRWIVSQRLADLRHQPSSGLLTVGFIGTVLSASSGLTSLMVALNRAYDVVERRSFLRRLAAGLVSMCVGGVLGILTAAVAVLAPLGARRVSAPWRLAITWLAMPVAVAMLVAIWSLAYAYLPDVRPRSHVVVPGAVVGVLLCLLASWALGFYVSHLVNYELTYGTLGGAIVMLMWLWISSMTVLVGAEVNKVMTPVHRCDAHDVEPVAEGSCGDPALTPDG